MATVYFTKPVTSDLRADVLAYLRDAVNSQARMFEGDTLVSPPVNAVRYVAANNRFEKWSGSVWDPLNITGNVTPTPPGGSTNQVQFNAGSGNFGGSANLTWDGTNKLLSIESRPALVHVDGLNVTQLDALDTVSNSKSLAFFPASGQLGGAGTSISHRIFHWSATHNRGWALAHNHPASGSGTGEMFFNALQGSTWQGWKKLWHEGNFDPATKQGVLGYTPANLAGDTFTGLVIGRSSGSADVNTANDTGSFSARGSSTTVASMTFHRTGAYAINMGLGTDNVFRIGGWSASVDCFQMDGTGNLTMRGNVTANGGSCQVGASAGSRTTFRYDGTLSRDGGAYQGIATDWRQSIFGTGSYMWDWWRMRNGADTHTLHLQCTSVGALTISNTPWTLTLMVLDQSGNFTATGNVTAYSDERLKANFAPAHLSLEQMLWVRPEEFDRTDNGMRQVGVRAQALRQIIPLAVQEDESGMLSVDYGKAALVTVLNLAREVAILKAQMEAS